MSGTIVGITTESLRLGEREVFATPAEKVRASPLNPSQHRKDIQCDAALCDIFVKTR